jgi:hypothetical protein
MNRMDHKVCVIAGATQGPANSEGPASRVRTALRRGNPKGAK